MFVKRFLDLNQLLEKKSFFLFGPRATGKSSLVQHELDAKIPVFNLLKNDLYLRLSATPELFSELLANFRDAKIFVIDEIQRLPILLNEVHRMIEEQHCKFLLTGSSARKLKQSGVNLLAGRAWQAELFPFTSHELPEFHLERYLQYGGLASVCFSDSPEEELNAYAVTYLQEEIRQEALVRNLPAFSRFLTLAAASSGDMINFSSIASDVGVAAPTIREYYQILEDTFLGFLVPVWQKSVKRKPAATAKFYLFDLGVRNVLMQNFLLPEPSDLYGQAFEHFIALELRAYLSYTRKGLPLQYWHTKHGDEVDFIVGDEVAIEVKSTKQVNEKHKKSLLLLVEEKKCKTYYLVSRDPLERKSGEIRCLPWDNFLRMLWANEII